MFKEIPLEFSGENRFAFWCFGPVGKPLRAECTVWGGEKEPILGVLNYKVFERLQVGPPEQVEITRYRG
jgi:hypothetical protein